MKWHYSFFCISFLHVNKCLRNIIYKYVSGINYWANTMVMINGRIVINLAGNKCIYMSYFHTHETSCQVEVECIYIQTKSNFLSAPYMPYTMLLYSFYECRLRRAKRAELKFFPMTVMSYLQEHLSPYLIAYDKWIILSMSLQVQP